jgi:RNA polymerase sigma-70 factor (ECF subfamily)
MSSFDAKPSRTFDTANGVTVIVNDIPLPEPRRAPEPADAFPRAVIVPPNRTAAEQEALARSIREQYGSFIRERLLRRGDLAEESTKDLEQRIVLVVCARVEENAPPKKVRGFIRAVLRNEVANHKRLRRPDIQLDADIDAIIASAPGPETNATRAEQRAKLERYIAQLSPEEAAVIRAVDGEGLTLDEAAAMLGRPRGTVATQHDRAREKLREMARASERAAALGARRPDKAR